MLSFKERLTDLLLKNNLITQENLNKAISIQKQKGSTLSEILVNQGFINERSLALVLSHELKLPVINLSRYKIDEGLVKLIPLNIAQHYQIIPVSLKGKTITLAMVDPLNIFAIDHIHSLTGYDINPVVTTSKDIVDAITQNYGISVGSAVDDILKNSENVSIELIQQKEESITGIKTINYLDQEAPVVKITNFLLNQAIRMKASDVLIEPFENNARVRYRIDGVFREAGEAPPKSMVPAIISRVKVVSELNVAEHRLPQDGRFKMKFQNREVDFRVSILPSSFGEKAALRVLDKTTAMLDIEKLGFSSHTIDTIKIAVGHPHGMVLVCGPTGSGKTTTLYSLLKLIDSPKKNIITVEDPIEYQLKGINQVNVHPEIGLTFASCLRSILRQDPDIIMVGEIRDFDTVDVAIKAALTGHLVLSTLHTNTASGAIVRLVNMGVEPFLISAAVLSILAQRLVRKICDSCKEPYKPAPDLLDKLTGRGVFPARHPEERSDERSHGILQPFACLPARQGLQDDPSEKKLPDGSDKLGINKDKKEVVFYRGKGCDKCLNTGYSGRVGISEVFSLSPAIKDLILERAPESKIKETAGKEGMQTLREDGIEKVLSGVTTLEEILRVTTAG